MANDGGKSPRSSKVSGTATGGKSKKTPLRGPRKGERVQVKRASAAGGQSPVAQYPPYLSVVLRGLGNLTLKRVDKSEYRVVGGSVSAGDRRSFFRKFFTVKPEIRVPMEAEIYLDSDDALSVLRVVEAAQGLLADMGCSRLDIVEVQRGSIWVRFVAWLNAEETEATVAQKTVKVATELEHYIELATVEKLQAEVDDLRSISAARMIAALKEVRKGASLLGALLVLKYPDEDGEDIVMTTVLTPVEVAAYKAHPGLKKNPETVVENLAAIVAEHGLEIPLQ